MANGNIGAAMAQEEIDNLLEDAKEKRKEEPREDHCPDHDHQQRVNYAMLMALSALLREQSRSIWLGSVVMGITAGVIIGLAKVFGV